MKMYEAPRITVILFAAEDVICSSTDPLNLLDEDNFRMRTRE